MDTLVNLQAFLATAEAAGFSAAARKLNVSTSVVSKRVTQLEAQIGTVLFHRSTRQLRLTEAGQRYVHRARSVVADVGDLLSGMGEKDHDLVDQLRIKAPTSLTTARLADILSVFQTQNPGLKLEIVLIDRPVDPVTEGLPSAHSRTRSVASLTSPCIQSSACCAHRPRILPRMALPGIRAT
jgi:DNA-binding transcriptional LysR family regulator